jgi:glycosyltransferase involved in cell wall biosynthesis
MMPAYNAERLIGEAIESLQTQTYPSWELIVVDDGSTDRTAEIVNEHTDLRIKCIHQENRGEAAARNTALEHVRGEFLSFLDADDRYLPFHLELAVDYLSTHLEQDGVYTDGFYIDVQGNRLQTLSSRRRGPFQGDLFEEAVYGSDVFGPPACVVLRTSMVTQLGLRFDESIVIGPDWDFFTKFAEGAQFGYLKENTCEYRIHLANISLRTGLERRALELAKCRINAIKLDRFGALKERTRYSVFYDLLVNQLRGYPDRQSEIIIRPEFKALRPPVQACLLRLMASRSLVYGIKRPYIESWLKQGQNLNPKDWKGRILLLLLRLSPVLLKVLLKIRMIRQQDSRSILPFADLNIRTRA